MWRGVGQLWPCVKKGRKTTRWKKLAHPIRKLKKKCGRKKKDETPTGFIPWIELETELAVCEVGAQIFGLLYPETVKITRDYGKNGKN